MSNGYLITGQIAYAGGEPAAGAIVRAFGKDLPSLGARAEQRLGVDAIADDEGLYRIAFTEQDLRHDGIRRPDQAQPDLFIRVFDAGTPIGTSEVYRHALRETRIDLCVAQLRRSEYQRLVHALTPSLGGVEIADLTDEDLAYLRDGIDARTQRLDLRTRLWQQISGEADDVLPALRSAAVLARQARIPEPLCYAWVRLLAPIDLEQLAAIPAHYLRVAATRAVAEELVPASVDEEVDAAITALGRSGYVTHTAHARLVEPSGDVPILQAGYKLHVFDITRAPGCLDLGIVSSDDRGECSFTYAAPRKPASGDGGTSLRRFLLRITDPQGQPRAPPRSLSVRTRMPSSRLRFRQERRRLDGRRPNRSPTWRRRRASRFRPTRSTHCANAAS